LGKAYTYLRDLLSFWKRGEAFCLFWDAQKFVSLLVRGAGFWGL